MFFSIGGAANATMVTAVLPAVSTIKPQKRATEPFSEDRASSDQPTSSPASSEATLTPTRPVRSNENPYSIRGLSYLSDSRLAGLVGAFAGLGALVALGCFLPLPSHFQRLGNSPSAALKDAYYAVGAIALIVGLCCFFGLRKLPGEQTKGIHSLWRHSKGTGEDSREDGPRHDTAYWRLFAMSIQAAGRYPDICLAYIGGFVARASSVGLSLFIPLYVNHYFISSGLCHFDDETKAKSQCPEAYLLAAKLTGISQLVGLLTAPLFGYLSDFFDGPQISLLLASVSGIIGYSVFAFAVGVPDPGQEDGSNWIYLIVSLLGLGQIGAIVCSLGLLSRVVSRSANVQDRHSYQRTVALPDAEIPGESSTDDETQRLLSRSPETEGNLLHLKGSIAGTYSLSGGVGILLL